MRMMSVLFKLKARHQNAKLDIVIINLLNENQDYKALFIELNKSNKFNGIKLQMEQLYNNLEIYIDKPRKDLFYNEQLSNFTENN